MGAGMDFQILLAAPDYYFLFFHDASGSKVKSTSLRIYSRLISVAFSLHGSPLGLG
jgi:hypothetical protein